MEKRKMTGPERLFSLEGRVALVTGSVRGLGLVMAEALAECGAQVYLNGREEAPLRTQQSSLAARGIYVSILPFDITNAEAGDAALKQIIETEGRLDILVNNAGPRLRRPIDAIDDDSFRGMLDAHIVSPFRLARQAAEAMKTQGYGRILMVASAAGLRGVPNDAAYSAAKGGVLSLTRALASEYGQYGITCNAIVPGRFLTESNAAYRPPSGPLKRWGDPAEIAGACIFLASSAASFVTGTAIEVDGGVTNCF